MGVDYRNLSIPPRSIIYCDPPYENTKQYKKGKDSNFDKKEYCDWVRKLVKDGHKVYCSEYNMPEDFVCIWQKGLNSSLRANDVIKGSKKSVERLFVHESQL